MRIKKLISGFLAAVMTVVTVPVVGVTAETVTDGYYSYEIVDGCATITEVDTSISGDVVIPDTLGGAPVTEIGYSAFWKCTELTSIKIPDGVTSIGGDAFYNCTGLASISIPDGVMRIGSSAFYGTEYYNTEGNWENGVLYIGNYLISTRKDISGDYIVKDGTTLVAEYAFASCHNLTGVIFPSSLKYICNYAFCNPMISSGCENLTSVILRDGIISIGFMAFSSCAKLADITIPDSVTSIGDDIFIGCSGLTNINVSDNNTEYKSINGILFSKDGTKLICYPSGKISESYIIPDGVTSIGDSAFWRCTSLTSVTIPDSVTSIGEHAFGRCTSLTSVTIPDSVTSIGEHAFDECTSLTSITIPDSVTSIGDGAFYNCPNLTIYGYTGSCAETYANEKNIPFVAIDEEPAEFYDGFYTYEIVDGYATIIDVDESISDDVIIPDTLGGTPINGIGENAFSDCSSLTNVTIPDSVTSIGENAFSYCTGLTNVTIPNNVTYIGDAAFSNCENLWSVTIPDTVTYIGDGAFDECSFSLIIHGYDGSCAQTYAHENDHSFSVIGSPYYYKVIDECVWIMGADESISGDQDIPDTFGGIPVTNIYSYAFMNCTKLTSITIPDGVTRIDTWTFLGCTGLTSVTLPDSLTNIGYCSFKGCTNLIDINIPNSLIEIADEAFENCSSLTNIVISDSVTNIGKKVFLGCDSLEAINVSDNNAVYKSIDGVLFSKDGTILIQYPCGNNSESYTIPDSVTTIGETAFDGCKNLTNIIVHNGVSEIEQSAFRDCTGLISFTIPNSVTKINYNTFSNCTGLTDITIPDSVTYISDMAFNGCTTLSNIIIPDSVTVIESSSLIFGGAFYNCTGLINITISNNITSIGSKNFCNCTSLTSVTIPDSVNSIEWSAFDGCTNLTSIVIPDSVTSIGYHAFYNCPNLTIYGYTDSYAETYAHENSIPFVALDEEPDIPSDNTFTYETTDSGVTITSVASTVTGDVVIPEAIDGAAVTSISAGAFDGCEGITSITVPASVTEIEQGTFDGMEDLTLCGISRSAAEIYAASNSIKYERTDSIIAGDVNGDSDFNITDATTALKIIAQWEGINANETAADVNMDGSVTTVDVLNMLKYIAKWDGIYLF